MTHSVTKPRPELTDRKTLVRGEPVVKEVLEATVQLLAAVGYTALRVEDVAARAGVNKTTVYRRYPTKQDLVRAALMAMTVERFPPPDTGSLRGDLLAVTEFMAEFMRSAEGGCVSRVIFVDEIDPELRVIVEAIREANDAKPRVLFERAVKRGEIASAEHANMVARTLLGGIHNTIHVHREAVTPEYREKLVDMLLGGVLAMSRGA